ncbi:DUF4381 domain-containing protein [Dyella solisilvae]|uniref:DUF4381 domain-containing protein n=1 Tax=Dyella solisilvae TaxID=1920168 RepID=A0A370K575_9GAMM|nr:DUF4381 domain-containing protein [Dyella solisilvae]RDI97587.1 DUF4381 domain-containing protein [Dyella solisilvae]
MIVVPAKAPEAASIAQLKDIADPSPVSWAPQTAGWWVLAAIVLVLLSWWVVRRWRRWRRDRYRREAQAELARIERAVADPSQRTQALLALPALVKRTVLAWAPRAQVAPLSGAAWLAYLDRTFAGNVFSEGPGKVLGTLAYGLGEPRADEITALMALLHQWIDGHVPA